ncbi:putative serine/threonine-kinase pknA domain protein [Mycobacterium xenopi 3993]|nr:putative serine/threonine-kinase pknA domain protein [Mycobacterium xenopi 3993]
MVMGTAQYIAPEQALGHDATRPVTSIRWESLATNRFRVNVPSLATAL